MIDRIEKKFVIKKKLLNEFINFIEINKKMKRSFKDRKVNSLYFDNDNSKFILENLNGFANRIKLRLRWYNKEVKLITFEAKIKKGNKTEKIQKKFVNKESIFELIKHRKLNEFIPSNFQTSDNFFINSLINYNRTYYESEFCRLTIDKNIRYFNIHNNKIDRMFIEDDLIIVEVKIDEKDLDSFLNSKFDLSPLVNIRMSKYMRGRSFFMNFEYF
jgi:hypothetical protein